MDSRTMRIRFHVGLLHGLRVVWPVLSGLVASMVLLGLAIGWVEDWSASQALWFTFVTGLTIGYGDVVPDALVGRVFAVAIGACGVLLTGLVAAIGVRALAMAAQPESD